MTSDWGASQAMLTNSWRIAAALVRRHPDTFIYEGHPGGGQYDVLYVGRTESFMPPRAHVLLNRVGTIQMHDREATVFDWPELGDVQGLHRLVVELERATGWGSPSKTPGATRGSLAYRFIAAALELLMFDEALWDARSGFFDSALGELQREFLQEFPSALAEMRSLPPSDRPVDPASRFWALQREGKVHLVVSDSGTLHRRNAPPIDLTRAYIDEGRRMRRMALVQVADWL